MKHLWNDNAPSVSSFAVTFPKVQGHEVVRVRDPNPVAVSKALAIAQASNRVFQTQGNRRRPVADAITKELFPASAKSMYPTYRRLLNCQSKNPALFSS